MHGSSWMKGETEVRDLPPLGKSQVATGFRRNTGMDPPQEAIGPLGSNYFSSEVHMAL